MKKPANVEVCVINVTVLLHGGKSLLIETDDDQAIYIAYSLIFNDDIKSYRRNDKVNLIIPYWLAKRKGLI